MPAPLTCPGCGQREGVRLVMGHPAASSTSGGTHREDARRAETDAACRACGAQWASGAPPSR